MFINVLVLKQRFLLALEQNQFTPLHWSAKEGHASACSVLVDAGAAVNARDVVRAVVRAVHVKL